MLPTVCSCDSSSNWPACRLFFADGVAVHVFPIYALHALQGVRWRKKIKKDKVSEERRSRCGKGRKVAKHCVSSIWYVAPEGRKVGSLKRRVRSQLARWEMKNCTPLWCEAHFQVKMHKTHQARTTFGSWDAEKVHAVLVRSTCTTEKAKNTPRSEHSLPDERWKIARRCGAKHISKSKRTKHTKLGPLLEVEMSKKCTPLWREAHFEVKMLKALHVRTTFGRSDVILRGRRKGLCTLSKVSTTWKFFLAFPKTIAGVGHLKRICKDAFSVAGAVQETFSTEMLGGQGADFRRGTAFCSIRSSVLGRWSCVTGAALRKTWHQFFVAGAVL